MCSAGKLHFPASLEDGREYKWGVCHCVSLSGKFFLPLPRLPCMELLQESWDPATLLRVNSVYSGRWSTSAQGANSLGLDVAGMAAFAGYCYTSFWERETVFYVSNGHFSLWSWPLCSDTGIPGKKPKVCSLLFLSVRAFWKIHLQVLQYYFWTEASQVWFISPYLTSLFLRIFLKKKCQFSVSFSLFLKIVAQASLELFSPGWLQYTAVLLPQPPQCLDYRCEQSHPADMINLGVFITLKFELFSSCTEPHWLVW